MKDVLILSIESKKLGEDSKGGGTEEIAGAKIRVRFEIV